MTVSIIVPVFNAEPWIKQCLESIRNQTYKDIELVLIDDSQGTGAAAARNRGLDKATGDLILFCDADDYLEPDAVEKMVSAIDGVDMVCGSFRKFGDFETVVTHPTQTFTAKEVAAYAMGNLLNPRTNQMLSGCWAKLYRRRNVWRFPDITTAEDMAFNFDYLLRCDKVRFLSDVVYHNRKRQGSLSTTYDQNNRAGLFGFLKGLKRVREFLFLFYDKDDLDNAIDNSKMYHAMLYFSRICNQFSLSPNDALRKLYP